MMEHAVSDIAGAQKPRDRRIQQLSKRQRIAIWTFLIQTLLIAGMFRAPMELVAFLTFLSIPVSLTFFVQMAALSLETFDRAAALALIFAMALPLVGALAILRINYAVTAKLRAMGSRVSLFGIKKSTRADSADTTLAG